MGRGVMVSKDSERLSRPRIARGRDGTRAGRYAVAAATAALGTLALAGCGSGNHFVDNPKPATPIDLAVYIDNNHVSISPSKIGAGPVILYVTNEATGSETLSVKNARGSQIATTGAINSGQTAQVAADIKALGTYSVLTGSRARPAQLKITHVRQSADNALLQP